MGLAPFYDSRNCVVCLSPSVVPAQRGKMKGMTGQYCEPITELSWGRIRIGERIFKDIKIFPHGAREWDWRETGTQHQPGIQIAGVEELLNAGAKIVILSTGMWKYLHVRLDTLAYLQNQGIIVHVLQTEEAVKLYNQLCESEPVAALIHSTC